MKSRLADDNSRARKVMTGGLLGALLLAIAAFFGTGGVRSRPAASETPSMIPVSQSPGDDVVISRVADADNDSLDLQLD